MASEGLRGVGCRVVDDLKGVSEMENHVPSSSPSPSSEALASEFCSSLAAVAFIQVLR